MCLNPLTVSMAAYGGVLLLSLLLCSDCDKIVREGADDCGLKIQHVLPVEAGVYHCGQSNPPHISSLPVSVVTVTDEVKPLGSKFRCEAVSSSIVVSMRWLHQGRELNQSDPKLMINSHRKNTALWVPRDHPLYRDKNQLECEVVQGEEIHVFSLIQKTPEPSGLFTDDTTHFDMNVRYVVVCFLLIALLLCLSVTLVWTHSSGCRFLRGQNNEEVYYENIRESSRLHRRMAQ
uniref:Ig-like domain-containing protein n=1 Tax=Knipowitschia caucasica TaxID=637954 RepID=A0AAV2LE94_KNICA